MARPRGQNLMRWYESTDLRRWNYLFSSSPDPRWYGVPPQPARWDHMYILPKEERGNPGTLRCRWRLSTVDARSPLYRNGTLYADSPCRAAPAHFGPEDTVLGRTTAPDHR